MDNSLFFCRIEERDNNREFISMLKEYSEETATQIYMLNAPMILEYDGQYEYDDAIAVLIPRHKITIINLRYGDNNEAFERYCEDFVEDLGYLSDKYDYRKELGRPREWKREMIKEMNISEVTRAEDIMIAAAIEDVQKQRNANFLISLLIGSINDISRIGGEYPQNILEQVKKKIILFDGDQSRFVYAPINKRRVTIQGLAGTGKTELLLHKLKDLYTKNKEARIVFTCYNKVLSKSMRKRIPEFFNFMRVEEQIEWNERLFVMHSWGSEGKKNSGVYSYICETYKLKFHSYFGPDSFDDACRAAIDELQGKTYSPCFDYVLIDESQDFPVSFFDLCEKVTANVVYVAGDIFQDIYDRSVNQSVNSDYLLNKCYRTDPRTLMFAHAVGMGLYEKPVLRWLEDSEWSACGYNIERNNGQVILSRVPIRRFDDMDMSGIKSIDISSFGDEGVIVNVIKAIDGIRQQHDTVKAEDIAVVLVGGGGNDIYAIADNLSLQITQRYGWSAVKGYETKDSTGEAVFISNKNNIKGLEFPFVICVFCGQITDSIHLRNTIYMILTRSFITSYFIINKANDAFIEKYQNVSSAIEAEGKMTLREPTKEEIERQNNKVRIAYENRTSLREIMEALYAQHPTLTPVQKKSIKDAMKAIMENEGDMSEEELKDRGKKLIEAFVGE